MGSFAKRTGPVAAIILAVFLAMPAPGHAQIELPIPLTSPSPSPTSSPKPKPTASSTPAPRPTSGGGSTGGSGGSSTGGSSGTTSGTKPGGSTAKPAPRRSMPPAIARALSDWLSRPKTPAQTTTRLLGLIDAATGAGVPTLAQQRRGFGQFPVIGYVWYQDDYGAPRFGAYYAMHEGTDLFAVTGTPVTAVVDGTIWKMQSTLDRGKSIWLKAPNGSYYFYGHLGRFARGLSIGKRVRAGDLIGAIGTSADAQGTYPHVHFEIHPTGTTETINPKPVLDTWLADAEANAAQAAGAHTSEALLAPYGAARWATLFGMLAEPSYAPPALWAAGYDGTGSTAAYADLALADLLRGSDWTSAPAAQGIDPMLRLLTSSEGPQQD